MNLRSLKLRVRALFAPRRTERELDEELAFHLEREVHQQVASGVDPAEARRRARVRFGSTTVAADECRDERGTAWVDNFVRDVLYAFRMFRRAPIVALAIVTTVALGLGLVAVVFTFFNALIFRVDNVRNPREMFAVTRSRSADSERVPFTRLQYEALLRETGVFSDAYAIVSDIDSRVDGRTFNGSLVTGNFFHVLGAPAALGRTLTPADDERVGSQPVVVLSHSGWSRYFAEDPGVLGRTLLLNGISCQIVGVMPEGFRGLMVSPPDYWAPLSFVAQIRRNTTDRDTVGVGIIGRLKPGLSRERALAELVAWDARHAEGRADARSRAPLALEPRRGTAPVDEAMWLLGPLFFAFGLILMIGCANVANLLLARAVARQREIGIRLATGASRRRIIGQLLTESLVLALVSAGLGFAIARVVLGVMLQALTSTIPPDLGDIRLDVPPADWRVALFLFGGAIVSTMAFALAPAFQATRLELVRAIRGEVVRDARPGRTRGVLIAIQVSASALLLVCSAVFLRSALSASTVDPGFRTSDTLTFDIANERTRTAMLDAVRREPFVTSIAASWPGGFGFRGVYASGARGKSKVVYRFVSPEYFDVLGIDLVRGRGFAPGERNAAAAVAVVSERAARELWPDRDPLNQIVHVEPDPTAKTEDSSHPTPPADISRSYVVVGVARNVPGFRFIKFDEAVVYVPITAEVADTALTLRVHGDPELARRALLDRLTTIDPHMGVIVTFRTFAGMETYFLNIGFWMTLALGALALVLTLSGLFSVLSYLVEQRSREIGVRMALGATHRTIYLLVLRQMARPVLVGLLIGGGLAAALGGALMSTPAAEQIGTIVHLFDPVAYATSLILIIAACASAALIPARRAGRIDPVVTLRQD